MNYAASVPTTTTMTLRDGNARTSVSDMANGYARRLGSIVWLVVVDESPPDWMTHLLGVLCAQIHARTNLDVTPSAILATN